MTESKEPRRPKVATTETVRVVRKHHGLVRFSHWATLPLLIGLIASGLSIYWASPVFQHPRDPVTGSREYLQDISLVVANTLRDRGAGNWVYDHFSLGTRQLATALRFHWLVAYLFMANAMIYAIGLAAGGGWRELMPRRSDPAEALAMMRFYAGVLPMALLRKPWPHPPVDSKYNALQRAAYLAIPLVGLLAILSGWAMHQPSQLGWLERSFGNYGIARMVHFICMLILGSFVVPHVILVIADGWDTFRSMVVGWSRRVRKETS